MQSNYLAAFFVAQVVSAIQCCPHDSKCQQYVFPPQPLLRPALLGVLMRKEAVQAKRI